MREFCKVDFKPNLIGPRTKFKLNLNYKPNLIYKFKLLKVSNICKHYYSNLICKLDMKPNLIGPRTKFKLKRNYKPLPCRRARSQWIHGLWIGLGSNWKDLRPHFSTNLLLWFYFKLKFKRLHFFITYLARNAKVFQILHFLPWGIFQIHT